MTAPTRPPRPRQVTLAAWLIMLGSAFVVLTVFERVTGLHSLESQEAVSKFLSEPPGSDLGLGMQSVLDILHAVALAAGACAAAAAVLGFYVLQGSRGARLGLALLALPLFLSGLVAGGFMSSVVVASSVMLWFQPARDWFNGVTREPLRTETSATSAATGPRAFPGFGSGPTPGVQAPTVPADGASAPADQASGKVARAGVRPSAVVWACALTWVFATLAVAVMASSIAVLAANPELVFDELRSQNPELVRQGLSDDLIVRITYVMGGIVIIWSLLAILFSALTFQRVSWARVALVVSASASAGLCLVGTLGQVLLVLPLAASVVTLSLLVRPDVRAWFNPR
ncbi:MAG TPA: hypothetical protein VFT00_03400 [Nocardioides sp.]|nr:hypothetical protein [Nocardioides sp.]